MDVEDREVLLRQRLWGVQPIVVVWRDPDERGQEVRDVGADTGPVPGQSTDIQSDPHGAPTSPPCRHTAFRPAVAVDRKMFAGITPCPIECSYRTAGAPAL